ncbi:MAG: hypothetical protein WC385_01315 [Candidatus Paceibacterota bacterium]|jgi:hypothetical protein
MSATRKFEVPGLSLARELFRKGTDCLGPEEVEFAFGASFAPAPEDIPPIPLSEAMLKHLRKLGVYLELHGPTAMVELYDALGNKLDEGKLLYDNSWYQNEAFYTKEKSLRWHWRATLKGLVPDSTSKKYLSQTRVLAEYLKDNVFAGQSLPKALAEAVTELNDCEASLSKLVEEDWQKGAEQLADLAINQRCRQTPAQTLWSIALYKRVNGEYVLPNVWAWTNQRSSNGNLVLVGEAGADGVIVAPGAPWGSGDGLGAQFSCSVEDYLVS